MTEFFGCKGQEVEVHRQTGTSREWQKAKISGSTQEPTIYQVQFPDGTKMLFTPERIRGVQS